MTRDRNAEELLFRGTLSLAMISSHFFLTRTGNSRDHEAFGAIVKEELTALIERMHALIVKKYAELGQPVPQ